MQSLTGSIGLSLPSTGTSKTTGLSQESSTDLASGLGFLAMFMTQIYSAVDIKENMSLPDQLMNHAGGGKILPQALPLQQIIAAQSLPTENAKLAQILNFTSEDGIQMRDTLLTNMDDEYLTSQSLLTVPEGEGDPDSFTNTLLHGQSTSALRGALQSAGTFGYAMIAGQIGGQGWGDEFVSRLQWQISQDIQEARINLNPRELGPLQVKINIQDDQAYIQFIAQHGVVREAIEDAIPRLREMLEQSGLMLADANISQQSHDRQRQSDQAPQNHSDEQEYQMDDVNTEKQTKVIKSGMGLVDAFI